MRNRLSYIGSELAQVVVQTSDPATQNLMRYLKENEHNLPHSIEATFNGYRLLRLNVLLFMMKDLMESDNRYGKVFDKIIDPLFENILRKDSSFPIHEHSVLLKKYLDYSNTIPTAVFYDNRADRAINYFYENFAPRDELSTADFDFSRILFDCKRSIENKFDEMVSFCNDATFAPVLSSAGLFSFSGRRNRLPYFIINCILLLAFNFCEFWFNYPLLSLPAFMAIWAVLGLGLYISLTNTSKRLHDLNHPAWFALVILAVELLPLIEPTLNSICLLARLPIGLYLTFWLGTEGTNQYGRNPLLSKTK